MVLLNDSDCCPDIRIYGAAPPFSPDSEQEDEEEEDGGVESEGNEGYSRGEEREEDRTEEEERERESTAEHLPEKLMDQRDTIVYRKVQKKQTQECVWRVEAGCMS